MNATPDLPLAAPLRWTPQLVLAQPQMDRTHEEFVSLLNAVAEALRSGHGPGIEAFERLLAHTIDHFGAEDRWMGECGFAPENCHTHQHAQVISVMREVVRYAREEQQFAPLRVAVEELALWFPTHAQMMDAALAEQMRAAGIAPELQGD